MRMKILIRLFAVMALPGLLTSLLRNSAAALPPQHIQSGLNFISTSNDAPEPARERLDLRSYCHIRCTIPEAQPAGLSLRRLKLLVTWRVSDRVGFHLQGIYKTHNRSKTNDKVYLQHAYLSLDLGDGTSLRVGQFKPPFGWERFQPDYRIPTPERSTAIDKLIPNGSLEASFARDYGAEIILDRWSRAFRSELTIMGGSGANSELTDENAPLFAGRLTLRGKPGDPFPRGVPKVVLQLAYSTRRDSDIDFVKQLPGADRETFQSFSGRDTREDIALALEAREAELALEYLHASYDCAGSEPKSRSADGWFVQFSAPVIRKAQGVVKYESFNPDRSAAGSQAEHRLSLGMNYEVKPGENRIMLAYTREGRESLPGESQTLIVQLQYFLL